MLLASMFFQDAISVPPVIGLILAGAFPHLRPLKFPEPAAPALPTSASNEAEERMWVAGTTATGLPTTHIPVLSR